MRAKTGQGSPRSCGRRPPTLRAAQAFGARPVGRSGRAVLRFASRTCVAAGRRAGAQLLRAAVLRHKIHNRSLVLRAVVSSEEGREWKVHAPKRGCPRHPPHDGPLSLGPLQGKARMSRSDRTVGQNISPPPMADTKELITAIACAYE